MHDRHRLTSDGFAAIFRGAEACWFPFLLAAAQGLSNEMDERGACCACFE
jgi:hypothetical protein